MNSDSPIHSSSAASDPDIASDSEVSYRYRDFGKMPEEKENVDSATPPPSGNIESSIRVQKFPVKLYAILARKEFQDIITWMPHGRSWKILKPNRFETIVMPLFFEYSNYHSFNRLINAWSFRRISSGPDRGSYYHELFLRGKPFLQKYMRRLPKTHKKLPMKKEDEPDFYKLEKDSPLPPLEKSPRSSLGASGKSSPVPPLTLSSPSSFYQELFTSYSKFGRLEGEKTHRRVGLLPLGGLDEVKIISRFHNLQAMRQLQQLQLLERQRSDPLRLLQEEAMIRLALGSQIPRF